MIALVEIVAAVHIMFLAVDQFLNLTPRFLGFRFLGVILILIAVAFVIMSIISSALTETDRDIFFWQIETDRDCMKVKTMYCSIPLALVVVALGIFMVVVSSQGGGKPVPGRTYKKYEVDSYSKYMQNKVYSNWDHYYNKAIVDAKDFVCAEYHTHHLPLVKIPVDSAFKSGCCVAPRGCKLCSLTNNTTSQGSIKLEKDDDYCSDDCNRWDNDPNTLCFDCESCKAGFLQDLTVIWFPVGIQMIITGIVVLLMQICGI